MYVNRIDNNTNFKMGLKVSPRLKSEAAKKGAGYLDKLEKYGKKMADIKLYDVVFDENLRTPKIFHINKPGRDLFKELKTEEQYLGKYYEVPDGLDGSTRGGFNPDEPRNFIKLYGKKAREKYAQFKKLDTYEQAHQYCRMLEKIDKNEMKAAETKPKEQLAKQASERLEKESQEALNQRAANIIERYKYDEPKEILSTNVTSQKLPFKQRLKNAWSVLKG